MRRFLPFLIALALASALSAASQLGGPGLQRGLSAERFEQLNDEHGSGRYLVDAKPWIALRFDDSIDDQYTENYIKGCIDAGVPWSMAVITDNLGQAGSMTVAQIQELIALSDAAGVKWELTCHGNTGFESPNTYGYAELLNELEPDQIEALFGVRPTFFSAPGDAKVVSWVIRNRGLLSAVLDSMGYQYADFGYGSRDSTGLALWQPHVSLTSDTTPSAGILAISPGHLRVDPYWLNATITLDVTNDTKVERDASEAWGATRYDDYGTGNVARDSGSYFGTTWAYLYNYWIANGWGGIVAFHDSTQVENGIHHVIWTLDKLRDEGFINLGTVSDLAHWAMGRYAPGTNLIVNPNSEAPSFAIGDTSGIHIPWLAGFGSPYAASANWSVSNATCYNATVGSYGQFDRAAADFPGTVTGLAVDGWGFNNANTAANIGSDGGILINAANSAFWMVRTMLPPGYYELTFALNQNTLQAKEWGVAYGALQLDYSEGFEETPIYTFNSRIGWYKNANTTITAATANNTWREVRLPFWISADPPTITALEGAGDAEQTNWTDDSVLRQWWGGMFLDAAIINTTRYANFRLTYYGDRR